MLNLIVYELNEVPWDVVDLFIKERPQSNLADILNKSLCVTTQNEDTVPLKPFNSWPTLHKSMYTADHHLTRCGQDPGEGVGENLWDAVEKQGLAVGLFGPIQSWPSKTFSNGGFYIPDTFSRTPETHPEHVRTFQTFNLKMTVRNKSVSVMRTRDLLASIASIPSLLRCGVKLSSVVQVGKHFLRELKDRRYRARRSILQGIVAFDVFWKLYKQHSSKPGLYIYFTNHVASMIHRFWGHSFSSYRDTYASGTSFTPDPIHGQAIVAAMDLFDVQLGTILKSMRDEDILVVASSIGQGPIPYIDPKEAYVLDDLKAFLALLNLPDASPGPAMYPRMRVCFRDADAAEVALNPIQSIRSDLGPLFTEVHTEGPEVVIHVMSPDANDTKKGDAGLLPRTLSFTPADTDITRTAQASDLGIKITRRHGGNNTAHHTGEGIFIAYGESVSPNKSRKNVSVLDVAPSLLSLLKVTPPEEMQGRPSIF